MVASNGSLEAQKEIVYKISIILDKNNMEVKWVK